MCEKSKEGKAFFPGDANELIGTPEKKKQFEDAFVDAANTTVGGLFPGLSLTLLFLIRSRLAAPVSGRPHRGNGRARECGGHVRHTERVGQGTDCAGH